jgi:NADH-quinone oxidoreductase subunit M
MTASLDLLLLLSLATVVAAALVGRDRPGGWVMLGFYCAQLVALFALDPAAESHARLELTLLGEALTWRFDGLSWFFAMVTLGAAALVTWFAAGAWSARLREQGISTRGLHLALALNVLAMLLLLGAGDLLSLFIGWELVSWAGLLLMIPGGRQAVQAGIRYITYAIAGGMAVLAALVLAFVWTGSWQLADLVTAVPDLSPGRMLALVLLFFAGFSVKMGVLPFHLWQAPAYAFSPGPAAAFLGAISSRMGLYAIALVVIKLVGVARLSGLELVPGFIDARGLLAWIAAFTIIIPTFTALRQNDARLLLAWHGIGQGGYMLLGLLLSDPMGSAGGLLHVFNYAACQAALFMSVFAVVYRTGTSDLNKLGGLVVRMPLSFLVMLFGIIGLAGLPPMNGFVSKWLVYRALVNEGMPLLFVASVIGTLGTILSVYKLIHNMFLGQLRAEYEQVSEAPWSMTLPMLVLSAIVFVTGMMPGLVLEYVAAAQKAMGLTPLVYTLGGADSASGSLDMLWVSGVLFGGFGVGALLFYGAGPSRRVHQLDNYAGGHFLSSDVHYQYSDNFYAGLMHRIRPWYRNSFQWAESSLVSMVDSAGTAMQGFFRQGQPVLWVLVTATLALGWVIL